MKYLLFSLFFCLSLTTKAIDTDVIKLNGTWQFCLDEHSTVKPTDSFTDVVTLPGTTDTNRRGWELKNFNETTHLSRRFSFVGKAWYQKNVTIPKEWKYKTIRLVLERTKPTMVYVDGKQVGTSDDISVAQEFDLTNALSPGQHLLTICVDNTENSVPKQLIANSHAYTEDTQTNWNGIIGEISLKASDEHSLSFEKILTNVETGEVKAVLRLPYGVGAGKTIRLTVVNGIGKDIAVVSQKTKKDAKTVEVSVKVDKAKPWSEFHPYLYTLEARFVGSKEVASQRFGFVHFDKRGQQFYVNGHKTFLRGKHDACVFPLTGHVAMDVATWRRYFKMAKSYGINHYRFHSWCPPEACFQAADELGIYLQPELPFWGDFDSKDLRLMSFLLDEGKKILKTYGHHPSFVMMALGNELWGDISKMKEFVDEFRKICPEKLFTFGSNFYLGYQGWKEGMDYFTTCRTGGERDKEFNTHTRGSFSFADTYDGGYINHTYPNTRMNFDEAVDACPLPIISHETCQFQMYPNYKEMDKYTGVLRPCNFEVFRERLKQAGMLNQANDFFRASGTWSALLYRADIEMDLRTKHMAGFQLLDLQDYPGQGSAFIGPLDAFMEPKGIISGDAWRRFCSEVVILGVMDRFCWKNSEQPVIDLKIANYSENSLKGKRLRWVLTDGVFHIQDGALMVEADSAGLLTVGTISLNVSSVQKAKKLKLVLFLDGTDYKNDYPLWIYPDTDYTPLRYGTTTSEGIYVSNVLNARVLEELRNGGKVLLMPRKEDVENATVEGLFQTDYWNYRMFKTISENNKKPVSPGTLGILVNPSHPLFGDFPTESYSNWQWFSIVKESYPLILDRLDKDERPLLQVIDNIERNHKLGLVMEFQVESGKLLICMSDLVANQSKPEVAQFIKSMRQYMNSHQFNPDCQLSFANLKRLLTERTEETKVNELRNISFE